MKLNVARPNKWNPATANCAHLLLALAIFLPALIFNCAITVSCSSVQQQPDESAEKSSSRIDSQQAKANETLLEQTTTRGVSNLHLTSDFRSVKLRWNYEHNSSNKPASFRVRYCELTSWNVEIKCRDRELRVASNEQRQQQQQETNHLTVITAPQITMQQPATSRLAPIDCVQQLDPPLGSLYEAQIYDLRALTNYTFNVRVARFSHEPIASTFGASKEASSNRGQAGRRLSLAAEEEQQPMVSGRIETKPFSAEATKCLADVSEVVVNTGKYFGGRISVEGSSDPRCTLIGNRTSDQSSYLLRIDHEVCGSKTVDGRRIESMVLVHENKDILTHNSARFLVLCNFLQRSFTLRASVSLPKVNGLLAPSKPAVITSLPGRPTSQQQPGQFDLSSAASSTSPSEVSSVSGASRGGGDGEQALMLGSMPGIYRPRTLQAKETQAAQRDANRTDSIRQQQLDELENNTIEKFPVAAKVAAAQALQQQRQPKELDVSTNAAGSRLAQHLLLLQPPAPVQVQSKVLFVDRSSQGTRLARQHNNNRLLAGQQVSGASLIVRASPIDKTPTIVETYATPTGSSSSPAASSTPAATEESVRDSREKSAEPATSAESLATPIIMTNNHRVSNEYLPVAQTTSASDGYSIKYSAAQVGEYSLGSSSSISNSGGGSGSSLLLQPPEASSPSLIAEPSLITRPTSSSMSNSQSRARSGRMRSIDHQARVPFDQQLSAAASSLAPTQTGSTAATGAGSLKPNSNWSVSERMGDLASEPMTTVESTSSSTQPSSVQAESTATTPIPTVVNSSLAHNITSYLLKWSLKTLSNLAKKSLESLIDSGDYVNSSEPLQVGSTLALEDGESRRPISLGQSSRGSKSSPGAFKASEFRGGNWRNSANSITTMTTTTTEPTVFASNANETRSLQPPEPTKSMLDQQQQQQKSNDEPMLDGFITSNNSQFKDDNNTKKATKASLSNNAHSNSGGGENDNNRQRQQHHSRPSNYSKSLDFSKSSELARTDRGGSEIKSSSINSNNNNNLGRLGHQRQQSLASIENGGNARWPIYSAWLLYGMAVLIALLVGLFLILWLVTTSQPWHSPSSASSPSIARLQPAFSEADIIGGGNGENGCRVNPIAFDCQLPASRGFRLAAKEDEVTYRKYDYNKFENYSSNTIESGKLNLAAPANTNKLMRPMATTVTKQQQESPRSAAARSSVSSSSGGSANTMLMSDEHDCRNSELLYNGESYA